MEPKFQTSFIPKRALESTGGHGSDLLTIIASFLFIISLVAAGGVYFYSHSLDSQLASDQAIVQKAKDSFDQNLIETLISTDKRLSVSNQLLTAHTALSPFFTFLGQRILKNVRFDSMTYAFGPKILITAHGQAQDYEALAAQSESFATGDLIHNPIFSDFNLDQTGNVAFSFSAELDPYLVSFEKNLQGNQAAAPASGTNASAAGPAAGAASGSASAAVPTQAAGGSSPFGAGTASGQ